MTFLGKLLVMVNVGVSLVMAYAAVALYFNGVDWGYDKAKPGEVGGLLKQKQAEIAEVQTMQAPNESAWKAARPLLWKQEEERRKARAFFVAKIDHNRNKANQDAPALAVEIEKTKEGDYRAKRDPKAPYLPVMKLTKVRGEKEKQDDLAPLQSRAVYQGQLLTYHKENLGLLDKLAKEFKKDDELTRQIFDKSTKRGLQPDLMEERVKRQKVEAERRLIKPLYVNTAVESELSLKRLKALKEQIKQLRAYCANRGMDVDAAKE